MQAHVNNAAAHDHAYTRELVRIALANTVKEYWIALKIWGCCMKCSQALQDNTDDIKNALPG
jgi:hypothetical protein